MRLALALWGWCDFWTIPQILPPLLALTYRCVKLKEHIYLSSVEMLGAYLFCLFMFPWERQKCHRTGDTGKGWCSLGQICILSRVNTASLCVACLILTWFLALLLFHALNSLSLQVFGGNFWPKNSLCCVSLLMNFKN